MSSDVQEDDGHGHHHHETLGERLSHMLSPSAMFAKAGTAMGEAYAAEADALQEPLVRPHAPHDGADLEEPLLDTGGYQSPLRPHGEGHGSANCHWLQTTATLLTLQLGWGLWLIPSDFAHLGWLPGGVCLVALASLTVYSGFMFTRLYQSVNGAVLFGDIGEAAAGKAGRQVVYAIIYSLDATRCVILHLAATQSLRHIFPEEGGPLGGRPPLWQCGLAVLFGALLLAQIRSLSRLSWFFLVGTGSQAIAIGIVVLELIRHPNPEAKTQTSIPLTLASLMPAAVALMNMIFAYGGQFAFIEVMTSMKKPALFARSVSLCTTIMTIMYASLGVVGYWSRGDAIGGIIIFSLPPGVLSSTAAAFILLQATAQYLVNLNVWSHNLLTLVARKWDWNVKITCTSDHARLPWLLTTSFVLLYSFAIAVTVPYFSPLVGIVTSITYLTCAYTIPSWFTLKLVRRLSEPEKWLLYFLIPASIGLSIFGFYASFVSLLNNASGGEGSFGSSA